MSDLYRINLYAADAHDYDTGESGPIVRMILDGVLVPIERCGHWRFDAHWGPKMTGPNSNTQIQVRDWCKGAGLEDTES